MASFGNSQNAFLMASQETTVAFAYLNFDFAHVKYNMPEYKELGGGPVTAPRGDS
jgi:hypothetical protein